MKATLLKVFCYRRDSDGTMTRKIWFEVEDASTRRGLIWSPSLNKAREKAKRLGYTLKHGGLYINKLILKDAAADRKKSALN